MLDVILTIVAVVVGYLLGSVPTGYLIARSRGIDIQTFGSGNIGATNVLRAMGPFPALIVVLVDPLKGALAVLLAMLFQVGPWGVALAGLAAVLGNNFNAFLGLRGGKGIATTLGVFLVLAPITTLLASAVGIFTMAIGRFVSLGSLVGILTAIAILVGHGRSPAPTVYLALALFLLAVYRHRGNLQRLAAGTERRLGQRSQRAAAATAEDARASTASAAPTPPTDPRTGDAT